MPTIEFDFDSGAIVAGANTFIDGTNDNIYLDPPKTYYYPVGSTTPTWWWWCVRVTGWPSGKRPFVRIRRANNFFTLNSGTVANEGLGWWTTTPDDPDSWAQFDTQALDTTHVVLQHNTAFPAGTIYLAFHPMFPFSMMESKVAEWTASPYVTELPASTTNFIYATQPSRPNGDGRTCPALPCYGFRIHVAGTLGPKRTAILLGGTHPNETGGNFALEAAIDFLLSADPAADRLRRKFDWFVYPCYDPQGKWGGYYRNDASSSPLYDNNREWDETTVEAVNFVRAAIQADVAASAAPVGLAFDYHQFHVSTSTATHVINSGGGFGAAEEYVARMQVYYPTFEDRPFDAQPGQMQGWRWMQLNLDTGDLTLALTTEVGSRREYGAAAWRLKGQREMLVVDSMVTDGYFGATANVVTDLQYRLGTAGTFTALPTQPAGDTSYTLSTAGFPSGTLQVEIRARDTSDDAASAWVRRTLTVQHVVIPPPPAGTFLSIDGVVYRVIADEPEIEHEVVTTAILTRAWDGTLLTDMLSMSGGGTVTATRRYRCRIYDLTPAELDTLRAALQNRRRVVVNGDLVGDVATVCTGTIDVGTARVWRNGSSSLRTRVSLTLETVQ